MSIQNQKRFYSSSNVRFLSIIIFDILLALSMVVDIFSTERSLS